MKFKPNTSKFKYYGLAFTLFLIFLFSSNTITAHASNEKIQAIVDAAVSSAVNSTSDDAQGGMVDIHNGVCYNRTGYLCYLLTKDGAIVPGCPAVALQSPGYNGIEGAGWICQSRAGHTVSTWYEEATAADYWNLEPWQIDGKTSNEPSIKAWMKAKNDKGVDNALAFVTEVWNNEAATQLGLDNYVLVIETIMSVQFSKSNGAADAVVLTDAQIATIHKDCQSAVTTMVMEMPIDEVYFELEDGEGITGYWGFAAQARAKLLEVYLGYAQTMANYQIISLQTVEGAVVGSRTYYGSPVIGTPSNLIKYDVWNTTVFDSYLNKTAVHAEKIQVSEAGFEKYDGPAEKVPDSVVHNYGVAMMIVHCADPDQTTCDESQGDTPHNPPKESEGEVTIIKSYREKNPTTGTYQDKGTYHLNKLGSNITIENEPTYKVVGWKTSTSGNTGISSLTWESDVPSIIGESGTTATTITLPTNQKYLYVLLEKGKPEPLATTNYTLPQSTISRHIVLSTPDAQLTLPKITEHTFNWTMPDVNKTSCDGHTCSYTDSTCTTGSEYTCDSCEHGCSEKSNPSHKCDTCDDDCGKWVCGGHECSEFKWKDDQFKLSLKNDKAEEAAYAYITSTAKSDWNAVTKDKYTKDVWKEQRTRSTLTEYIESKSGLDYHTVIHRGETDLVLAQWKNAAASLPANTDLETISAKNYKVADSLDSVSRLASRKTSDYTTSFTVNIVDNSEDKRTQYGATVAAPVTGDKCGPEADLGLDESSIFTATPTVDIKVYPGGTASPHTDINNNPQYYTSGATIYSGIMAKSGTITNFTPYVQMKYQTIYNPAVGTPSYEKAYVLSENKRSLYLNSYAEIEWDKSPNPNLTLSSLQWSTHKEAATTHPAGTVLPGGATLTLTIKSSDRQQIIVRSFQPILVGAGLTQVTNTNGTTTLATLSEVQTSHTNFVSSVANNLENLNIQQFLSTEDLATDVFTSGGKVDNGVKYKTFGGSEETKYYFNGTSETIAARQNESAQGDLDVKIGNTDYQFFTFWSDPAGNIRIQHQEVLFFCSFLFM